MNASKHDRNIENVENIKEALAILETETKRRIDDVQQRVEFICASLRAQGNTQINKMLMAVRELTMEEFCETYQADAKKFLNQQKQQRLGNTNDNSFRKRRLGSFGKSSTDLKKRKTSPSVEEKEPEFSSLVKETSPVLIHVNKPNQPEVQIQINPDFSEKIEITMSATKLSQLDDAQRAAVKNQIQQIIDQLNQLQKNIV